MQQFNLRQSQNEFSKLLPDAQDALILSDLRKHVPGFFLSAARYKEAVSAFENEVGDADWLEIAVRAIRNEAIESLTERGIEPAAADRYFRANLWVQQNAENHLEYELTKIEAKYGAPSRAALLRVIQSPLVEKEALRYQTAKASLMEGENEEVAMDLIRFTRTDLAASVVASAEKNELGDMLDSIGEGRLTHLAALAHADRQAGMAVNKR